MQSTQKKKLTSTATKLFKKQIPTIPLNGKTPVTKEWQKHCETLPTKREFDLYLTKIKTGIGLPLGPLSGLIAIDIDATNKQDYELIKSLLPTSPIRKKGKKGSTYFFRYNGEDCKKIKRNNIPLVELLSKGNQTVIPPSLHPDTKKEYFYMSKNTLENFDLSKLPILPPHTMSKIENALNLKNNLFDTADFDVIESGGGRNDKLKEMASAMIFENKKSFEEMASELISYDGRNHLPPLLSDKREGICKADPFSNAINLISNVLSSINKNRKDDPITPAQNIGCESNTKPIEVLTLGEFLQPNRFPERIPIVEGLMNQQELHLLSAPAKVGKTILQINLALAVARGETFLNFKAKKGKVLIIQTEVAGINFQGRLLDLTNNRIKDIKNFIFISSNRVQIDKPEGLKQLEEIILKCKPSLVILDPFYTLHTSNEDSSSEIAPVLTNLREIIIKTNTTCLLIHHQGKGVATNTQTGHKHRGSSSFADVPDGSWSLNKLSDPKMASLSFELRNHESPSTLRLVLNDNLKWIVSEDFSLIEETLTIEQVRDELNDLGEITSNELVKHLEKKFSVCTKTARNKIKETVCSNLINYQKVGRNKYYSCAKR